MFNRNNLYLGLLFGSILPALAVVMVEILRLEERWQLKESLFYMICLALNALLLRYFFKLGKDATAKGILLVTFIYAITFYIYKFG